MYGRKVKLRFFFVLSILLILAFSSFFILKSLEENVIYFQSPSEINSLSFLIDFFLAVEVMLVRI